MGRYWARRTVQVGALLALVAWACAPIAWAHVAPDDMEPMEVRYDSTTPGSSYTGDEYLTEKLTGHISLGEVYAKDCPGACIKCNGNEVSTPGETHTEKTTRTQTETDTHGVTLEPLPNWWKIVLGGTKIDEHTWKYEHAVTSTLDPMKWKTCGVEVCFYSKHCVADREEMRNVADVNDDPVSITRTEHEEVESLMCPVVMRVGQVYHPWTGATTGDAECPLLNPGEVQPGPAGPPGPVIIAVAP